MKIYISALAIICSILPIPFLMYDRLVTYGLRACVGEWLFPVFAILAVRMWKDLERR